MPERFNSQTPTIDQGIVKFKQLATRISLSLGLAIGAEIKLPDITSKNPEAILKPKSNIVELIRKINQ